MMRVRKLPAVDFDSPVFFIFGMGVVYGSDHYGRLSLYFFSSSFSSSAETGTILKIIIPNPVSASKD